MRSPTRRDGLKTSLHIGLGEAPTVFILPFTSLQYLLQSIKLLMQLQDFSTFFNRNAGKWASTLRSCSDTVSSSIPLLLLKLPRHFGSEL